METGLWKTLVSKSLVDSHHADMGPPLTYFDDLRLNDALICFIRGATLACGVFFSG